MNNIDNPFIVGPTGRRVFLRRPNFETEPLDQIIEEVSTGLSREARFCGHTKVPWSVADHSLAVYDLAVLHPLGDPVNRLVAILHDASEAYLRDIPKPLKDLLPDYQNVEHRFQSSLFRAFGLSQEQVATSQPLVHAFDMAAMSVEADQIGFGCSTYGLPQPSQLRFPCTDGLAEAYQGIFKDALHDRQNNVLDDFRCALRDAHGNFRDAQARS